MTKPAGLDKVSRRRFIGRAACLAAAAFAAGPAFAQSAIEDIIKSPRRGSWDDQFDAQSSRSVAQTATRHPIASADTIAFVERAIFAHQDLIARGGWPMVPATKKLRMGVSDPDVRMLRQRLIASGDLDPSAGLSNEFDSYVDGAVKKFQARHGLPPDGVLGSYSYQALNVSAEVRLGQLETNL
ncbi:MAG: peptidoglycan-binding protein, partial [Hoeflea sp.]|nr:peptidoglycan-binding protein [Hoeflea sp.]